MRLIIQIYIIGCALIEMTSCKKFVDVDPPVTQLVGSTVYSTNSTAAAAVTGIYQAMSGNSVGGNSYGLSALLGLSGDEFILYPNSDVLLNQTYSNSLSSNNSAPIWSQLYNCIYQANSAIEGLSVATGTTAPIKQQLIGEAKFIRAFCNFYLINIFGDVPLITTTNYKENTIIARNPQAEVYEQIIADLTDAQSLLGDDFLNPDGTPTEARVRPNRGAATALIARVYLYQQKWESAETQATAIIESTKYILGNNLNSVFLANNGEAIWQLEMPNNGFNAPDGNFLTGFLYFGGPVSFAPYILNNDLVQDFEPNDLRKMQWLGSVTVDTITYYYPFKYKLLYTGVPPAEYPVVLRLAEQYLIRAEARAQENDLTAAAADLNIIRSRAGLSNTTASSQTDLLNAIQRERRLELFTEYGHRWLDLRRTGNLDLRMSVVTPMKGGKWNNTDRLYPIPITDIQANKNLTQNPGYQ